MIEKLNVLQEEAANCTKCCLSLTRNKSVFARGNPNAKILFLGEAPGQDENNEGKPEDKQEEIARSRKEPIHARRIPGLVRRSSIGKTRTLRTGG